MPEGKHLGAELGVEAVRTSTRSVMKRMSW